MFIERKLKKETLISKILGRSFDYGTANPVGQTFDRRFNREQADRRIAVSQNAVGQAKSQLSYPNGMSPDVYSANAFPMGMNVANMEPRRAFEQVAESQLQMFWRQNRERLAKYYRVAGRAEVSEALDQMCNEGMYPDAGEEICSLDIQKDADIGESVRIKLHKIFRMEVLRKIMDLKHKGWDMMRTLLIEGRIFIEIVFDPDKNEIVGANMLPSQNMVVIIQDGVIAGYRQMMEGIYATNSGGKNFVDFSVNQILFCDLEMYGPGGINDPRGPLEVAMKPFNQLNAIEDAVTMYRIQWGNERLAFYLDMSGMAPKLAEKRMKDQMKLLSHRVDYDTGTGSITNYGRVLGMGEHWFFPVSNGQANTKVERIAGGNNLQMIDDLKYFKRNLVNALKVPPGRITALAGDGENFSNGKIGEVTQAEVSFARMVFRYQQPMALMLRRLFVMVLNTKNMISDDIKSEDNFDVIFSKANNFQAYIEAEILNTNLGTFKGMMEFAYSDENPAGVLAAEFAMRRGLKLSSADYDWNRQLLIIQQKENANQGKKNTEL